MEKEHKYHVVAWWASGQTGLAKCDSAPNALHFTAPIEFGGLEGRWTPEDLLLCAVAGCFTTTFQAVAGYSKFEYTDLEVETEATSSKAASGYSFNEITVRPKLTVCNEEARARGTDLLKKAKSLCMISRALSATQKFEPVVVVEKAVPVG